ncbi:adenylate/guanylate cyclase domain-containing protein [Oscillatoria sp. FACHB-1406]|uniref:adenylate/guanylate cyclase domain-containing protein n=1 Tax=Oscillatoria sp. FACHB-1406 TaxID=2692846 RepID=UPI001F549A49|nr:adenylate/guanylate cyclase domain-containing protein [Oscillatoria sp. FACHB-1406]
MKRSLLSKLIRLVAIAGLFLAIVFPFTAVVHQLISEVDTQIQFARQERRGLEYNARLRTVLEYLIEHQSQVQRYLEGDSAYKPRVLAIESQIDREIEAIDVLDRRLGQPLRTSEEWRKLKGEWQQLKKQVFSLDEAAIVGAHGKFVTKAIALMKQVGDTSNLILDPVIDSYYLMSPVVVYLPQSIESIDSARTLGEEAIRRDRLAIDQQVQLSMQAGTLETARDEVARGMEVAYQANPTLKSKLDTAVRSYINTASWFLEDLARLKAVEEASKAPAIDLYTTGAQALQASFHLYDETSPALDRLLQARLSRLIRKKYLIELFSVAVLAIAILGYLAFTLNLEKRRQAEQAVRQAETKFRSIFENATEGIFQIAPEGKYLSANPALLRLYGYDSLEELNRNLDETGLHYYVDPQRQAQWKQEIELHQAVAGFESEIYRADGSPIWISENARVIRDRGGNIAYYEGTVVDITYRKAAEEALRLEQEQSERLLLNILPEAIARQLKTEPTNIAESFEEVTVLFADLVGFTVLSARMPPKELVHLLNTIFSDFDRLAEQHGLEKIKTIGDAYMVVGGVPLPRLDHAEAVAAMALDMQDAIAQFNERTGESFSMRIGINTGPAIAGVIGIKKFIYDLWGDTVNVASRMESHGLAGSIQVTAKTYHLLKELFEFEERGLIQIKGKGEIETYLLTGKKKIIYNS